MASFTGALNLRAMGFCGADDSIGEFILVLAQHRGVCVTRRDMDYVQVGLVCVHGQSLGQIASVVQH